MELTASGSPGAQAAGGFATRRQPVATARPWVSVVVMLCLAVVSPSLAWSASAPRDTSTVLLQLQQAEGGSRVPLLLELAELRRSESGEGVRLTDEALRLLERHPSPELEVSARAARSYALQLRGDYRAALAEAEHAERIARETKKPEVIAKATYAVAFVEWRMANYAPALAKAQAARSLLEPAGPSPLLVRTISLQGAIHQSQSDLEPALRYYLACLSMADTLHDEIAMGRAHNNIGLVYWDLGRNNEAYAEFQRALAIHERLGPPENLANTLNNMGLILLELQRTREAIPYLERTLAIDQKAENPYGEAKSLSNLGGAYEQLKMWRRALELHQHALAIRERIDDMIGVFYAKDALALAASPETLGTRKVGEVVRKPLFVPESIDLVELLRQFRVTKRQMAIVLDEYGGTAGVVTIEDVLEEIVGDIEDEYDPVVEQPIKVVEEGREIEVSGRTRVDEANVHLGDRIPEGDDYDTVAGWVFTSLDRIPVTDEELVVEGIAIHILEADDRRIARMRLTLSQVPAQEPATESRDSAHDGV